MTEGEWQTTAGFPIITIRLFTQERFYLLKLLASSDTCMLLLLFTRLHSGCENFEVPFNAT